ILHMVMLKPIQLTRVSAVPRDSGKASRAISVENIGESAITAIPQNNRNIKNTAVHGRPKIRGEIRQHIPEAAMATAAAHSGPFLKEIKPFNTHAIPPIAIIVNATTDTLNPGTGWTCRYAVKNSGTKAQNAYSSHICPK